MLILLYLFSFPLPISNSQFERCIQTIVLKRLKLQGFVTFDWHAEYPEAVTQITAWIKEVLANSRAQKVTKGHKALNAPSVI